MKIDLVYTWVNPDDEKWLATKEKALAAAGKKINEDFGTRASRWDADDELFYSLRSADKFAPWINRIFIVVDNGTAPKWLREHPRVTIVDHKDFIPDAYRPTFNSATIEIFLHKIPGLSEHYLYANDDMFFGASVSPDFFFDPRGNPIVIIREKRQYRALNDKYLNTPSKHSGMYFRRVRRAVRLVYDNFGLFYNVQFKHAIEPCRKSYQADNFKQFEKLFLETTTTPFRAEKNIQRLAFSLLDNAKGRNTLALNWRVGRARIVYDVRRDSVLRRAARFLLWAFATIFWFVKYDAYDKNFLIMKLLKIYRPKVFCLHNIDDKCKMRRFLSEMFPWT
ncbi:MAG: stealth family protein [Alphaproteobacteria bacterium]|nr:stealth family protein [Alphaproteobacteria bacterium]